MPVKKGFFFLAVLLVGWLVFPSAEAETEVDLGGPGDHPKLRGSWIYRLFSTSKPNPEKPTQLTITKERFGAELSWAADLKAVGYNIYVSTDGQKYRRLNRQPITEKKLILRSLVKGKPYFFALTSIGEEGYESEKTIQPFTLK
jgi:hypothetical protein